MAPALAGCLPAVLLKQQRQQERLDLPAESRVYTCACTCVRVCVHVCACVFN